MKSTVEIDIDDVLSGLSATDEKELAKRLAIDYLDVDELFEVIRSLGYRDEDILDCLDWEKVKRFVNEND